LAISSLGGESEIIPDYDTASAQDPPLLEASYKNGVFQPQAVIKKKKR
jgi:hypothetical protein